MFSDTEWDKIYTKHLEAVSSGIELDPYTGDFHSANTAAVFPEFDKLFRGGAGGDVDSERKATKLRKIGKVIGLSLLFQARLSSAGYTIHYNSGVGDSPDEASRFASAWYANVPEFVESTSRFKNLAKLKGYSHTMIGNRRYIPIAQQSENRKLQDKGLGYAINMPIQGSGAVQSKFMLHELLKLIDKYDLNWISGNQKVKNIYTHLVRFNREADDSLLSYLDNLPLGRTMVLVGDDIQYSRLVSFQDSWFNDSSIDILFSPTI